MGEGVVEGAAEILREYASHFEITEWDYTRHHEIRHIRRHGDYSGYDAPHRRLVRWLRGFVIVSPMERALGARFPGNWRRPVISARVALGTECHLPDGVLDGGAVITCWEETGEYLQLVQPSVGVLVAELLDAHPELPEVQAVASEIARIQDRYTQRLEAEAGGAQ